MGDAQQPDGPGGTWKVGALARATGLTVRALHYYDEIGLLRPSRRSSGGHRLYDGTDVARLYRICLLRRLGFPLDQVSAVLDEPQWQLGPAIDRHLGQTRQRAEIATRLCTRLAAMSSELARRGDPAPEDLFSTLEEMTMLDGTIQGTTGLLVYDDIDAAHDYLVRVFGLTSDLQETGADGSSEYRQVRAGEQVIGLHPSFGEVRSPRSAGAVTSMTVLAVDDVDAHYSRTVAAGADIVQPLRDMSYGVREYGARDPEGQLWFFHAPTP